VPGRWRIANPFDGWVLLDPEVATARESAVALSRDTAISTVDRLMALGPAGGTAALRSAATWLEPGLVGSPGAGFADYKQIIAHALAVGDLLLVRNQLNVTAALPQTAPPPGVDPTPVTPQELDWVELTVVDDEGEPYTGPYKLELPDGRVMSGQLNFGGTVRVDSIPSGTCKLSFPESADSA
jgi:hypothetical protein